MTRILACHVVPGEYLLRIGDERDHRFNAESRFGAHDRRWHLVGRKEVERQETSRLRCRTACATADNR